MEKFRVISITALFLLSTSLFAQERGTPREVEQSLKESFSQMGKVGHGLQPPKPGCETNAKSPSVLSMPQSEVQAIPHFENESQRMEYLRTRYRSENRLQELAWLEGRTKTERGGKNLWEAKHIEAEIAGILRRENYTLEENPFGLKKRSKSQIATFILPKKSPSSPSESIQAVVKCGQKAMNEVATYQVNLLYGLNDVPVTILRKDPTKGNCSFQYRVSDASTARDLNRKYVDKSPKMKFLDYLINNADRNDENWMYYKVPALNSSSQQPEFEYHSFAIDHDSDTFIDGKKFNEMALEDEEFPAGQQKLFTTRYVLDHPRLFYPGDEVYQKLKETSDDEVKNQLKPYLDKSQISDFLKRKKKYISAYDKMMKSH